MKKLNPNMNPKMTPIEELQGIRILCVGDVMLDRYVSGEVRRISPESPVPVLTVTGSHVAPGGAGNVARSVAALGGHCTLVSVTGKDAAGDELVQALGVISGVRAEVLLVDGRPSTEKIRFSAQGQHLLRTDVETTDPIPPYVQARLLEVIKRELPGHDALVLSDYAKGVLTDALTSGAIALAARYGRPCVVDPKSPRIERYAGATVITPNAKETLDAAGIDPTDDDDLAAMAGEQLLLRGNFAGVLVTRAHRGMTLVQADETPLHIPTVAREVFDVVGAGDTVVATLALSLGAGHALSDAARLANAAAGVAVGKRGTGTVTPDELAEGVLAAQGAVSRRKVLTLPAARALAEAHRRAGLRVGFTNGCFDLLHLGHLSTLSFAAAHCDRLIVGVNSDASVRALKGPSRPVNTEANRALLLAGLSMVDAVLVFDEDTPLEAIEALQPDVLVKGADYTFDQMVGADLVLARGGRVLTCPLVPGCSSTALLKKR